MLWCFVFVVCVDSLVCLLLVCWFYDCLMICGVRFVDWFWCLSFVFCFRFSSCCLLVGWLFCCCVTWFALVGSVVWHSFDFGVGLLTYCFVWVWLLR